MILRKTWRWLVLGALLISLAACTSGSVSGSGISCSKQRSGGSCSGSFNSLSGTYSQDIEPSRPRDRFVNADVDVSVDSGSVRVYVTDADGYEKSVTVTPDQPASLSGQARITTRKFRVYFEAVEGTASGVNYTINYTAP